MPAVVEEVRRITGKEPSHNLNPDECVALGAAVQGGKLGGAIVAGSSAAEIILMDVTPLSLGIETVGGVSTKIIDRNTTIPTRYSQIFTTAGSFQTSVDIKVLQGERQFARDNKLIGNFRLKGIKPAPAGVPQIEVTFDIDANGIVQVSAKDLGTGKHQEITITASSNLSDSEIEQAIREAQEYEATDGQRKAYIDARSEADTLVRQVENVMADKEKRKAMDSAQKKSVKSSLSYVKKLISRTTPKTATVVRDGVEQEISVDAVKKGDIFVVRPGENIPVDGEIIDGTTAVNESALTGESIPVDKQPKDAVSAATVNQSGFIKCRATRVGEDTTLSQIIQMVSDAAATKAPIAKIADRVSGVFVPAVITIAIITIIAWLIAGETVGFSLARGISVLVISCPCALGLATPVAIMVGNGKGAKSGILFKTAASLEATGRTQIVGRSTWADERVAAPV